MSDFAPQSYNKIPPNPVERTIKNISLDFYLADGMYDVSADNGTSNYPSTETKGILIVINGTSSTQTDSIYVITQKFISKSSPYKVYTRTRNRNGGSIVWTGWKQEEQVVDISLDKNGYINLMLMALNICINI